MTCMFPSTKRSCALSFAIFEMFFFGGSIFGWNSLVLIFQQEDYFGWLCSNGTSTSYAQSSRPPFLLNEKENESIIHVQVDNSNNQSAMWIGDHHINLSHGPSCARREHQFNLVFVLAIFLLNASSLTSGLIFDQIGTRKCKLISAILLISGYVMFAMVKPETSWLLFPATVFIAIAGNWLLITTAQIGNLFVSCRFLVIALLYGCFDASAGMPVVLQVLYKEFDVSPKVLFLGWAGLAMLILFVNPIFFLPKEKIPWPLTNEYFDVDEIESRGSQSPSSLPLSQKPPLPDSNAKKARFRISGDVDALCRTSVSTLDLARSRMNLNPLYHNAPGTSTRRRMTSEGSSETAEEPEPHWCSLVFSPVFLLQLMWFTVLQLNINFYIGTLNSQLIKVTDDDPIQVSWYTTVFQMTLLSGLLWSPVVGLILDRNRIKAGRIPTREEELDDLILPLVLTSSFALIVQIVSLLFVPRWIRAYYFTFVIIVISRAFLYTLGGVVILLIFPGQHFGKLLGVEIFVSSIFGLVQNPMIRFVETYLDGNLFYAHMLLSGLVVMTFLHPLYLWLLSYKLKQKAKKREETLVKFAREAFA